MEFIKKQYRTEFAFLKSHEFFPLLRNVTVAFFILLLVFFLLGIAQPAATQKMMEYIQAFIQSTGVMDASGSLSAFGIFLNNLRASAFAILYGLIPFFFLSAFAIGINAGMIGFLAAYYQISGLSMTVFIASILPHGIFELPALFLAFSCGIYLCLFLTRKIIGRNKEQRFSDTILHLLRTYCTLIIPLLIAAALIEAYLTPALAAMIG